MSEPLMSKYYIDERSGIIAVRVEVEYEVSTGLQGDLPDVVASWTGYKVTDRQGLVSWKVYSWQRAKAHNLCVRLNTLTDN